MSMIQFNYLAVFYTRSGETEAKDLFTEHLKALFTQSMHKYILN